MTSFDTLAFVDLETTGTRPSRDRITEIAIVRTQQGEVVERWSSLVNPQVPIPGPIQELTGINDAMVREAPYLEDLLGEVASLLQGAALVAHNASFDAGFLRHAFSRADLQFDLPVLCTVKLSRRLYPQHKRHNLDTLMQRFGLSCQARHRAMGDAAVLPKLVDAMSAELGWEQVAAAFAEQLQRESLPQHLDQALLQRLPRGPGVYLFYGDRRVPLYVGKSVNIRSRVLSHFAEAKRSDKELHLSREVRDIEWINTAGELSALLQEQQLVKELSPVFNRRLRSHKSLFSWRWKLSEKPPRLLDLVTETEQSLDDQYGLYRTRKSAETDLRTLAGEQGLCLKVLGLEKGRGPCFAYQLKRCRGACVGEESTLQHDLRLAQALLPRRVARWPYPHPVGVVEQNPVAELSQVLVLDQWRVLGSLDEQGELQHHPAAGEGLNLDVYKILVRYLRSGKARIVPLQADGRTPTTAQMSWL